MYTTDVREAALGLAFGLVACSSTSGGGGAGDDAEGGCGFGCADAMADVSLAMRAQVSLQRTCTGQVGEQFCHQLDAGGMTLRTSGDNFPQIIDVPSSEVPSMVRVRPGRPPDSYLYLKLVGDGGIEGGRMPFGGPYDAGVAELFQAWIEAGAPAQ
jgi:hypothetical protein